MIVTVILAVILIIVILLHKPLEYFTNTNKNTIIFDKYDKSIVLDYLEKCSSYDRMFKENGNNYLSKIIKFSNKEKDILTNTINEINNMKIFKDNNWNLVKFKDISFDYPHTLDKYIFLPENIIYSYRLKNILIHEKLHIDQRMNQKKYDKLYNKLYGEFIVQINEKQLNLFNIIAKNIRNPDADDKIWLIKQGTSLYYVPYIYENNRIITNRAYLVIKQKNNYEVTNSFSDIYHLDYIKYLGHNVNITHPNETYVDLFIINNIDN